MQTFDTSHFRKRLIAYVVLSLLLICITIGSLTVASQYSILKENWKANLLEQVENKQLIVKSYLIKTISLAQQMASRSFIRDLLKEYKEGTLPLDELRNNTENFLADGLLFIPEAVGITRLCSDGQVAAQLGVKIPQRLRTHPMSASPEKPYLKPVEINGQILLVVKTPIVKNQNWLGTDILLFAPPLTDQVFSGTLARTQGATFLWQRRPSVELLMSPANFDRNELEKIRTCPQLTQWIQSITSSSGLFEDNSDDTYQPRIVTYAPMPEMGWVLTTLVNQNSFYHTLWVKLTPVIAIAIGLTLLGGLGMYVMLRPMTRQVMVHSDELEQINLSLHQEIEERQQAEQDLIANEHEWSITFESITDAITIFDPQGHIRKQNLAARRITNSYGSALKNSLQRKNLVPVAGEPSPLLELALTEKSAIHHVYHDEVTNSFFRITITPLIHAGEMLGAVQLVHDITEQTRSEKLKSETVAAVSHEIRTPLTAIMGFVEFMQNNETTAAERHSYFLTIQKEMERLQELMNDFLDLQRLQSALVAYHFAPVNLEELLQDTVNLFRMVSEHHQLVFNSPGNIPQITGDEKRLKQVVKNILSNAVKYSPDGGTVTTSLRVSQDHVFIWIKDEGIGIPPQDQEKIFNRFYRVDDSDRRIPGGLGLGLTLVNEIVNAHHGRIWVESALGKGSTFFVELPINGQQTAVAEQKNTVGD
ncbi:ATP-binding protein [uncultured Desulfuromonas sp.]|uniref:sensor histidine kinase n=1 Tax=uncultured Desulfuromonas sp. TaxID=181013 RepID=UPI002AAB3B44|nr:ATP-binding protein [uncultured Desulfuromonas sp.]